MNNEVSITALMSSFGRAFHAENEDHPVFADHLAKELMTAEEYAAVLGYIRGGARFFEPEINPVKQAKKELLRRLVNVHIAPSPLCRAAYTEQVLKTAVLTGTKQYVMLGAGLDTFAFREKEFLSKHRVFEVDHPLMQKDKIERITRAGWTIPDNLTFVSADFTKDNVAERLIDGGFDASEKRVQNTIMMAKAGGEPMQSAFSYSEIEKIMEKHGFLIYELLTPDDIQRDIIDKAGADMKAFEHVNYCLAVRKN